MRAAVRDRLLLLLQPEQQQPRQMASPRFMCPSLCVSVCVCVCVCVPVCMAGVCVCVRVCGKGRERRWAAALRGNGKLGACVFLPDDHARAERECVWRPLLY